MYIKKNIIMLPGWGMNINVWEPIKEDLENKFNVFYIDWSNVKSINDFKKEVITLIKNNNLDSFSILGWSLGGLVALEVACENSLNFDIESIILIGSSCRFTNEKKVRKSTDTLEDNSSFDSTSCDFYTFGISNIIVENMKSKLVQDRQEVLSDFYLMIFSESEIKKDYYKKFLLTVKDLHKKHIDIDNLMTGLDYLQQIDLRNSIKSLNLHILLIHGENDLICPIKSAHYIQNVLPQHTKLVSMPDTGHIPFFTQSSKCINEIFEFLKSR